MFQLVVRRPWSDQKRDLADVDIPLLVDSIELDFVDELDSWWLLRVIGAAVDLDTVNPVLETTL